MPPDLALLQLGGVADLATLLTLTTRRRLRRAVARGEVTHLGHGRYAHPSTGTALRAAGRLHAVLSHESAALHHRWGIKATSERPSVIVPRHRGVKGVRGVDVRFRDLDEHEVVAGPATSRLRTVLDCAKDLPFDRALCVADSALREGHLTQDDLIAGTARLRGPGSRRARVVVAAASPLADNPFESTLRAIASTVPGLTLEPQVTIEEWGWRGRPDLVDRAKRIVVEADSFTWHGSRQALSKDANRYNALVARGWRVLRFTWEQVMFEPEYVRRVLMAVVHGPDQLAQGLIPVPWSA